MTKKQKRLNEILHKLKQNEIKQVKMGQKYDKAMSKIENEYLKKINALLKEWLKLDKISKTLNE